MIQCKVSRTAEPVRTVPERDKNSVKGLAAIRNMHRHIVLGGTFDRFHAGHEEFVKTALENGERITVGITTERLYRHKLLASCIEPYEVREQSAASHIRKNRKKDTEFRTIPLTDVYGTAVTDETADAIVVTEATRKGADAINGKRKELGKKPLNVIVAPLVKGEDGKVISSERIRYGDINRAGVNYYERLAGRGDLSLPENRRTALREPLGDIFPGSFAEKQSVVKELLNTIEKRKPPAIFSIGDIITRSLQKEGFVPAVSVVDGKSRREALKAEDVLLFESVSGEVYPNAAGTIASRAVLRLKQLRDGYMNDKVHGIMLVDGEEDLLALPAILIAPIGSIVAYGQYDLGVVSVTVTETVKNRVQELLDGFEAIA